MKIFTFKKVSRFVCFLLLIGSMQVEAKEELTSAYISAVKQDDTDEVTKLLKAGVNPDTLIPYIMSTRDCDWDVKGPAIEYAARHNRLDMVKILLKEAKDLNEPLMSALEKGHLSVVKLLLEGGANVDCVNQSGDSPLMKAVSYTRDVNTKHQFASLLLEANANVNHANNFGQTALMLASMEYYHDPEMVEILLKAGADIHFANKNGETALMLAVREHRLETVKRLLEAHEKDPGTTFGFGTKSINYADNDGNTALMLAISHVRTSYINEREYNICMNSQQILKILLDHPDIDPHIKNKYDQTAITMLEELQARR